MALKATVIKAELQISDMDRHYYASHPLTLAQHPSETETRLMMRLLAFALFADPRLEFGRGLSSEEEPDLWQRDYVGDITQWIDLGQPDPARIRKACARARNVVVVNYGGQAAEAWWEKHSPVLARQHNLSVLDISPADGMALTGLFARSMRLNIMLQDGQMQWLDDTQSISVNPVYRQHTHANLA